MAMQAISLLQPTTLPALPTTTPTRATAEATHRVEEASQICLPLISLQSALDSSAGHQGPKPQACLEEKGKRAKFVGEETNRSKSSPRKLGGRYHGIII
uniref:Uncharacterized protein n=1 Tax=Oryza barthii TaxID=65489 RepID=A0A0D3HCH2_9ORYZ